MKRQLHASISQEGEWFVAQCLEEDIASQGHTEEEALRNLAEALRLHFTPPQPMEAGVRLSSTADVLERAQPH